MLTDIFAHRYREVLTFDQDMAKNAIGRTLQQATSIFFEDVQPRLGFNEDFFRAINEQLARELGLSSLRRPSAFDRIVAEEEVCRAFLATRFKDLDDPDDFCKARLSMVELLFRWALPNAQRRFSYSPAKVEGATIIMNSATQELNHRLQANRTGLQYHNGLLQRAADPLSTERIATPFWNVVSDPKFATVDNEMKEAYDRLDGGQHDAFTHAMDALESTIKIISDERGWTRGNEKGAANYIDNLVSVRNGRRFIEVWEKDALIALFKELRNPHRHGGGSNPPDLLSVLQQTWAIESCMSWIKSLIQRNP
jgi:hypothetical protein